MFYWILAALGLMFFAQSEIIDGATLGEETSPESRLIYTPSQLGLSMGDWKYRGKKITWDGNPLVEISCTAGGATPPITLMVKSSKGDYSCQEPALASEPLAQFIDKHLMACVQSSMTGAGFSLTAKNVKVLHNGILAERRVNSGSNGCSGQALNRRSGRNCRISSHATGRAIDVEMFEVTMTNGETLMLPGSCVSTDGALREGFEAGCKRVGKHGAFYDKFVQCWGDKIRQEHPQCDEDQRGILDCDKSGHKDHLHMSIPICPHPRGLATT